MRIALYQPDIPQNAGAMIRLTACLGLELDIIGPCGFVHDDSRMRRAGLDYSQRTHTLWHTSWSAFLDEHICRKNRLVLLTTRATTPHTDVTFHPDDTLLLGRESCGVPAEVHNRADLQICVPMKPGMRSLNVVTAAAMITGEALRQTNGFHPVHASQV
ncbi:tRNA (cytidine(34)-2'-O)-methyltransferase [Haematospirillum sp. H1815]|uniref:tRNA (cytidine(34)-2'-O)-methyltransferase n=1 Tax=Haematospirillum sp. H1815 TaxID=2723108 RepID=UPI001438E9DF|nr:tRNA (cytidine(34)-2'-O)-methyltransferase [Haematospirillum sp. H1815]NKD78026.1 tRNA (cytidine(34)-2'-O)-methyltransferase [Haematospirillum sp. H1815]